MRTRAQQDLSSLHSLRSVQELAQKEVASPAAAAHGVPASDSESDYESEQYQLAKRLRTAVGYVQPRAAAPRTAEPAVSTSDEEEDALLQWQPGLRGQPPTEDNDAAAAATQPAAQDFSKQLKLGSRDGRAEELQARKTVAKTAGRDWYELPAPQITKEVENDLRLLGLRGVLATDRFYKRPDSKKLPIYFQMGTVIEGPAEFYSGRLTRRERQPTLTQEVVKDPELARQRKRRFHRLQEERDSQHGHVRKKKLHPRLKPSLKSHSGR